MEWIVKVLTSEFFWGVIVGVVLSDIQARLTVRRQKKAQKDLIKSLCVDIVNNITAIVQDMNEFRQRTQDVYADGLRLMDIELNIYGRNREHTIHLPTSVREKVRKFVTDCAIRRGEVGNYIVQYHRLRTLAQSQGPSQTQQAQMQTLRDLGLKALDQLAILVKDSADVVSSLQAVR
jgi:hypothetical protein